MNPLNLLRALSDSDAELDIAVQIDNQPPLRPVAMFLAHHRTMHAAVTAAIGVALAPLAAVVTTAATVGRVIDQTHQTAGEGTAPCKPCVTREADEFAADDTELTYADVVDAWDLADGGLTP